MKKAKLFISLILSMSLVAVLPGCSNLSDTSNGAILGTGGGAALGAGIGAIFGNHQSVAWGAGIGAVLGGTAGALVGNQMDKQKKELQQIKDAQVESINNGQAIKVTFDSGILFATGKSDLTAASTNALTQFATSAKSNPNTNIQIYGHTDNTGSDAVNGPLSQQRANSVQAFLTNRGVASTRMTAQGMGSTQPVADNSTAAGKAANRRVELFIVPNAKMLQDAQNGTLK
jgi:outer membrane protein OmpA-like peptidoglycan-associated protein